MAGRKKKNKIRFAVRLRPEIVEQIRAYARLMEMTNSEFIEELMNLDGKLVYTNDRFHERTPVCFRISQECLDGIRNVSEKKNITYENLIMAKLAMFRLSNKNKAKSLVGSEFDCDVLKKDFDSLCEKCTSEDANIEEKICNRKLIAQDIILESIGKLDMEEVTKLKNRLYEYAEMV